MKKEKQDIRLDVLSVEAPPRFELGSGAFAELCLTTWLWRQKNGASDEARTRYLHLGKVALYQMSYTRIWCPGPESNQRHADFQSAALPTELPGRAAKGVFPSGARSTIHHLTPICQHKFTRNLPEIFISGRFRKSTEKASQSSGPQTGKRSNHDFPRHARGKSYCSARE